MTTRQRPLSEVAYHTGFFDQSHLSQAFARLVGMTPAAFRTFHAQALDELRSTNLQDRV